MSISMIYYKFLKSTVHDVVSLIFVHDVLDLVN
jgi:hypothetical protein